MWLMLYWYINKIIKYQYSLIEHGLVRHPKYNKTKKGNHDRTFIENNDIEG
jgi:hypothetical protein